MNNKYSEQDINKIYDACINAFDDVHCRFLQNVNRMNPIYHINISSGEWFDMYVQKIDTFIEFTELSDLFYKSLDEICDMFYDVCDNIATQHIDDLQIEK